MRPASSRLAAKVSVFLTIIFTLFVLGSYHVQAAPQMVDYCYLPPFVTDPNTPPNIMLVFDRTDFGKNRAYQGPYQPASTTYYGFFDASSRYKYYSSGSDNYFIKDNACTPTAGNSYNCFPGNLLNFALMSTLDLSKKAFMGFGHVDTSTGGGDVFSYTGTLTSLGTTNDTIVATSAYGICGLSFAGSTYSYYFDIDNPTGSGNKPTDVTIRVSNNATCPTASTGTLAVNKKQIAVRFTDENRIGIIQKFTDSNKDGVDDYPNSKARFGMKRWKTGGGNDKSTEIFDDSMTITAANKASFFTSLLNTASSPPPTDTGTPPLGTMMHDLVNYFSNVSTYKETSSDGNTFTQSPYDWTKDPASACRKSFVLFVTAGFGLNTDSHTGGAFTSSPACSSGTNSTAFSQNACYGFNADLSTVTGKQNVRTFVINTTSGINCAGSPKKCTHTGASCTTDEDCTNSAKLQYAASVGGGEYIEVKKPEEIQSAIERAVTNILATSASASTVATLTTQTRESSSLTQAYFYPRKQGTQLKWTGYLRLLWSDGAANLREDTLNTGWLDLKKDKILSFYYDPTEVAYKAMVFGTKNAAPYLEMNSCDPGASGNQQRTNDDVPVIWNAQTKLQNRTTDNRTIKVGIDKGTVNGIVRGSESELFDFTTARNSDFQPFWNYGSYCSNYPSRWCATDANCNFCSTLRTTHGVDRSCSTNADCGYCDGDKTRSCTTSLTCTDAGFAGTCANAGAACGTGVCVSDCYKYHGTCNTAGTLACNDGSASSCSTLGAACGTDGTCQYKCTLTTDRFCSNNAGCVEDFRGSTVTGSGCITTDTCSAAAANTCIAECDTANCATSVIKFIRGFDKPTPAGQNFRIRHDPESSTTDNLATLKLGDIVYSTPRISPNAAVNGYHVTYKDASYRSFIQSTTVTEATPIVVVGANDGMVHAFKVGKIKDISPPSQTSGQDTTSGTGDGSWQTSRFTNYPPTADSAPPSDIGDELWAYVPYNVIPFLKWYCDKDYCHIPMVDARFTIVDASINGIATDDRTASSWRRLLVGSMGIGGKKIDVGGKIFASSVFVLDITDPASPSLLWERSLPDYTLTSSTPAIVRLGTDDATTKKNGTWYLVFGSGPEAVTTDQVTYKTSANAKLFVFNLKTGDLSATLDIGASGVSIGDMMSVDMDSDYQTDAVYFGTYGGTGSSLTGKLYRLRIRNGASYETTPSNWNISTMVNVGRPIYAAPEIAVDALGKLWIYFGTGLYLTLEHALQTTDNEFLYGVKETEACWKGSGTCSTYSSFYDTSTITFTGAKAVQVGCFCAGILKSTIACDAAGNCLGSCGDNKVCSNNISRPCASDSECPGGTCVDNKVVLKVKDATITGAGVPAACTGKKDTDAIDCLATAIQSYDGWRRAITGQKSFSRPFVAGGLVDYTTYQPTSTQCSLGGSTSLVTLHYTTGTSYVQPTLLLAGGTSGATTSITISPSVNIGTGIPPLGESLVALPLAGEAYRVITQVSGGLTSLSLTPSLPAKTGYILWLSK